MPDERKPKSYRIWPSKGFPSQTPASPEQIAREHARRVAELRQSLARSIERQNDIWRQAADEAQAAHDANEQLAAICARQKMWEAEQ